MTSYEHVDVKAIIPQREPFVMIDSLLFAEGDRIETGFRINHDNIFVEEGILREFALIENIAQSFAAGLGIIKGIRQGETAEGFMAAITDLTVYALPKVGDTIRTEVQVKAQFDTLYLLHGSCFSSGEKLLECSMKLAGKS